MFARPITTVTSYFFAEENQSWDIRQRKQLDSLLESCFQVKIVLWQKIKPQLIWIQDKQYSSHTREVYIGFSKQAQKRWIIKLDTAQLRMDKLKTKTHFPHAEEIAYQITQLLTWPTVPETWIFHQEEENLFPEKSYFFRLIKPFKNKTHPVTCTLQEYIEGETLAQKKKSDKGLKTYPYIKSFSYQQAFFLELLLNDRDAHAGNYLTTKEGDIYKIDNEYIGKAFRPDALNPFKEEKDKIVSPKIISDILRLSAEQLSSLQKKYTPRDFQLAQFWAKEPLRTECPNLKEHISKIWEKFRTNLFVIQSAINELENTKQPITLSTIYHHIQKYKAHKRVHNIQERLNIPSEKLSQLKYQWEKEKHYPPEVSSNAFLDIYKWIWMEHCVVLHHKWASVQIYYNGKEKSIENLNVIYINTSLRLLEPYGLSAILRKKHCKFAPQEIQNELYDKEGNTLAKAIFYFQFPKGY